MTSLEDIKELFSMVEKQDKKLFFESVAKEFSVSVSTVRTNWFTRFEVPQKYKVQDSLIVFMKDYIKNKKSE